MPRRRLTPAARSGGLFGSVQIINVDSGGDYDADAVALERFNSVKFGIYSPRAPCCRS